MAAAVVTLAVGLVAASALDDPGSPAGVGLGQEVEGFLAGPPEPRDLDPYRGLGTWVDVFDYAPAYTDDDPPLDPAATRDMAEAGVRTLYLQAVRDDERSPDMVVDDLVVGRWLIEAHRHGLDVVAWYLPHHADADRDLDHVAAMADFEAGGHRFDGIALDIEDTSTVSDVETRNDALVELSEEADELLGDEVLGAIVLPPVLLEVVNPEFWPTFPWRDLAGSYDVWLPMSYWTQRTEASGYDDGGSYNDESTRRMRANLGEPGAPVHAIGGIGDETTPGELAAFATSAAETDAIGASIYDWATLGAEGHALLGEDLEAEGITAGDG